MLVLTAIASVCEEFTDIILVDYSKNSIIVSVDKQWFSKLNNRLLSMYCKLVHKSLIKDSYTCTYVYAPKK